MPNNLHGIGSPAAGPFDRADAVRKLPERAKHTPGPWSLGSVTKIDVQSGGMVDDDESGFVEAGDCEVNLEGPNASANARLVAAAPDLLDALKAAPPLPIGFAEMNAADKMRFALDYADWWKDHCEAAIAKAES